MSPPITDYFVRYGRLALIILILVGTYRISDIVLGIIANVFYLDMGFTKTQIANYSKFWGLMASIAGGSAWRCFGTCDTVCSEHCC